MENDLISVPGDKEKANGVLVRCCTSGQRMTFEVFNESHINCIFDCPFGCGLKVTYATLMHHCKTGECSGYELKDPESFEPLEDQFRGHGIEEYNRLFGRTEYERTNGMTL